MRGTERQLSDVEFETLAVLCRQMQAYYPHQEFADDTIQGYMFDFERLAVIHGIGRLRAAFLNIRIMPGRKFFPHPVDVAEEIEAIDARERRKAQIESGNRYLRELAEAKALWEKERAEAASATDASAV